MGSGEQLLKSMAACLRFIMIVLSALKKHVLVLLLPPLLFLFLQEEYVFSV